MQPLLVFPKKSLPFQLFLKVWLFLLKGDIYYLVRVMIPLQKQAVVGEGCDPEIRELLSLTYKVFFVKVKQKVHLQKRRPNIVWTLF